MGRVEVGWIGPKPSEQHPSILTIESSLQWCMYTGSDGCGFTEYSWPAAGDMAVHRVLLACGRCDTMKPPLEKPCAKRAARARRSCVDA